MRNLFTTFAVLCIGALAMSAAEPWTSADLLSPEKFAPQFGAKGPKPSVYYVGFNVLYRSKHIPGAVYAGPGAKPEGLELLRSTLKDVPRTKEIVLYCGCCPIDKCPNLRPAFALAREMGFKNVKLVMLPTSFGIDWVEKGYPVETGQAGQ